jgi:hypothetical protein
VYEMKPMRVEVATTQAHLQLMAMAEWWIE